MRRDQKYQLEVAIFFIELDFRNEISSSNFKVEISSSNFESDLSFELGIRTWNVDSEINFGFANVNTRRRV